MEQNALFSLPKTQSLAHSQDCVYTAISDSIYAETEEGTTAEDYVLYRTIRNMCSNSSGMTAGELVVPIAVHLADRYGLSVGALYRIYTPDDYIEMAYERSDYCGRFVEKMTDRADWKEMVALRHEQMLTRWATFCYLKTNHAEYSFMMKTENNPALAIALYE